MKDITKIKEEFERIKSLGWVLDRRPNNRDGGIGNTFEDLLGVKENNLKDPDFEDFEVKTQRQITSSLITLFSKIPTFPQGVNAYLKDNYGEARDPEFPDLKKLYASIFAHRWSKVYDKYNMRLETRNIEERLYLKISDLELNSLEDEIYWSYENLVIASHKLKNLWVVIAESKKENNKRFYRYTESKVFLDLNFSKFENSINNGEIMFDLRMGVHKSGKNYGRPHDHGSGFRIKKSSLKSIYNNYIEI